MEPPAKATLPTGHRPFAAFRAWREDSADSPIRGKTAPPDLLEPAEVPAAVSCCRLPPLRNGSAQKALTTARALHSARLRRAGASESPADTKIDCTWLPEIERKPPGSRRRVVSYRTAFIPPQHHKERRSEVRKKDASFFPDATYPSSPRSQDVGIWIGHALDRDVLAPVRGNAAALGRYTLPPPAVSSMKGLPEHSEDKPKETAPRPKDRTLKPQRQNYRLSPNTVTAVRGPTCG